MRVRHTNPVRKWVPFLALAFLAVPTQAQVTLDPSSIVPISTVHKITKDHDIVVLRGVISRDLGRHNYILRDDSGSVELSMDRLKTMPISVGQTLTVRGEVHKYLTRARKIDVTEAVPVTNPSAPEAPVTPPPNLVPIWHAYFRASDGEIVTVGGKIIRRLESGEFVLRDDSGE